MRALPTWKAHVLTGDRKDVWSLHVTRNWRMTFRINDGEIVVAVGLVDDDESAIVTRTELCD